MLRSPRDLLPLAMATGIFASMPEGNQIIHLRIAAEAPLNTHASFRDRDGGKLSIGRQPLCESVAWEALRLCF
jgi:hypothetical protein